MLKSLSDTQRRGFGNFLFKMPMNSFIQVFLRKISQKSSQKIHDVVSTSIGRLRKSGTSYKRLLDVETTFCVYWDPVYFDI